MSSVIYLQGELKLLHDENDMLREQVVSLANQQTSGEATENSSTESSERLENICRLYRPRQGKMITKSCSRFCILKSDRLNIG